MKDIILTLLSVVTLFISGCKSFMFSHNATQFANGQYVRVGVGDYGLIFGDGTLITQAVRENTEMVVKMQNGNDFSGAPTSKMDSVKSVCFRTGPQVTGYLVDLAGVAPDAATNYVGAMPNMNKATWDTKEMLKLTTQKEEKSSSTTDKVKDAATSALGKLTGNKQEEANADTADIPIDGDGEYTELWKDKSITYQTALADKLLSYADDEAKFESGETYKSTLVHFLGRMAMLAAKGKTETVAMQIDRATVKDGKLISIMYRYTKDNGEIVDADCPSCFDLED